MKKKRKNCILLCNRGWEVFFYAVNCRFVTLVDARWLKKNLALFFYPLDMSPYRLDIEMMHCPHFAFNKRKLDIEMFIYSNRQLQSPEEISISLRFIVFKFSMQLSRLFEQQQERKNSREGKILFRVCGAQNFTWDSYQKLQIAFLTDYYLCRELAKMYFRKQRKHVQLFGF